MTSDDMKLKLNLPRNSEQFLREDYKSVSWGIQYDQEEEHIRHQKYLYIQLWYINGVLHLVLYQHVLLDPEDDFPASWK